MILLLAPLIAIAAIGGVATLLRLQKGGQRELVGSVVESAGRGGELPSILYFTGESCTICHTAQRPALRALAAGIDPGVCDPRDRHRRRARAGASLPGHVPPDHDRAGPVGQVTDINVGFANGEVLAPPAGRCRHDGRRVVNRVL